MRTFKKIRQFGGGTAGATGGKSNEALLIVNRTGGTQTVTIQSLTPEGSLAYVGPISVANAQSFIYPIAAYGWTASASGFDVYQLF
jgi:hypothetical protein